MDKKVPCPDYLFETCRVVPVVVIKDLSDTIPTLSAMCDGGIPVAEVCAEAEVPYLPGCMTPTEIMAALELGITTVKFFPANVYGGLKAIKALAAPFPQVKFLPTGGVDLSNIKEFLDCDKIAAVGGSFMMKGTADDIRENCRQLCALLAE